MRTRRPLTVVPALLAAVVLVGLAACGGDGDDTIEAGGRTEETTTSTTEPAAADTTTTSTTEPGETAVTGDISLTIQMTSGGALVLEGTLSCSGGQVEGTGHLADPAKAQAACEFLTSNQQARNRLTRGRPSGLMCTQQYGGDEVVKFTGTIDGVRVDQKIDQTDGCGIAEFRLLGPLFAA
jgi:hypothetical protein